MRLSPVASKERRKRAPAGGFLAEDDDESDDDEEVLRVKMPVGTARVFAKRKREIVGAGRPICVICGQPIDADGHTCTFPEN